jgi:hypothetical protein
MKGYKITYNQASKVLALLNSNALMSAYELDVQEVYLMDPFAEEDDGGVVEKVKITWCISKSELEKLLKSI